MSGRELPGVDEVRGRVGGPWIGGFLALAAAGAGGFAVALGTEGPRAWQAYLVNFLFWTGLAFGSVLVSVALTLSEAVWGRPLKRLAEAAAAFLPLSVALFLGMYPGRAELFPWVRAPEPAKAWWLEAGFLFARNGAGLSLLAGLGLGVVGCSVRRDLRGGGGRWEKALAVLFGLAYPFVLSLLAFDLVMSLDEHWTSTVFGAYYFTTSFYSGLAALLVAAALAARSRLLGDYVGPAELKDLATLTFAFCITSAYLFYCQYMTIWYGNVPRESAFLVHRYRNAPWEPVGWGSLAVAFGLPFVVLLSRKVKSRPLPMLCLAIAALAGLWLERFLLVAPSLWKGGPIPFGWVELAVTVGFLGLMGSSVTLFLRLVPMLPVGDPMLARRFAGRGGEG